MIAFLGRLHVLLLHLPIGILLLGYLFELKSRWGKSGAYQQAIYLIIEVGMWAALVAAATGYALGSTGDYEAPAIRWHQWMGMATAALSVLLVVMKNNQFYFALYTITIISLIITGHLGGSITHGNDFLQISSDEAAPAQSLESTDQEIDSNAVFYTAFIAPIIKDKCRQCHNPARKKGGLSVDTTEDLLKGGKDGQVLTPEAPLESALWQRLQLPQEEKKHMPPAAKPQLTKKELALIRYWLETGMALNKPLKTYEFPEEIHQWVYVVKNPENPVFKLTIEAASPAAIQKATAAGFSVMPLGATNNLLTVSCAGVSLLNKKMLASLKPIAQQIAWMDLANTSLTDELAAELPSMPHLVRLNVSHTNLSDQGLAFLKSASYLENLNLVGTKVSDQGLSTLSKLVHLKALYLWQTSVSENAKKSWTGPAEVLHLGATIDTAGSSLQLLPPKIEYTRNFFPDTLQVMLDFPFKSATVYYTLDGRDPDSTSKKYVTPLVIDKTLTLKTRSAKKGWKSSEVVTATFVKNINRIQSAVVDKTPSPRFPGTGPNTLIDMTTGEKQDDKGWMGFQGEHVVAVLDLGTEKTIDKVIAHCFENNTAWIFNPKSIQVWTSVDNKVFKNQAILQIPVPSAAGEAKANLFTVNLPQKATARYVKVRLESVMRNPAWHPSKGEKAWVFVDELLVE